MGPWTRRPTIGVAEHSRVRHVVDVLVADITTRAARAVGPAPLAYLPDLHRVLAETDLYRRQCHAERDLAELAARSV